MSFLLWMACSDISGQWRDYSFNKSEIPAKLCDENDCPVLEAFSLELSEETFLGDFRMHIQDEGEQFIYTLPIEALPVAGKEWKLLADIADYPNFSAQWNCVKKSRFLDCEIGEDLYQFRRGKHP